MTGIFGGEPKPPTGGNPDSNTLISDMVSAQPACCQALGDLKPNTKGSESNDGSCTA